MISDTKKQLLKIVAESKEGMTERDIAKKLNIHHPGVVKHVKDCEKEGWVVAKKREHGDKREKIVTITNKGLTQIEGFDTLQSDIPLKEQHLSFLRQCINNPFDKKRIENRDVFDYLVQKRLITKETAPTHFGLCFSLKTPDLKDYTLLSIRDNYTKKIRNDFEKKFGKMPIGAELVWKKLGEHIQRVMSEETETIYLEVLSERKKKLNDCLSDSVLFDAVEKEVGDRVFEIANTKYIGILTQELLKHPKEALAMGKYFMKIGKKVLERAE